MYFPRWEGHNLYSKFVFLMPICIFPGGRDSIPQSRQCSMRSSRELVPKSDGRIGGGGGGGGGGEGGGGTAFKSKLEIKSSNSSHQRLLGSSSVSPRLFLCLRCCCNRMAANNFSFSSMHRPILVL